MDDDHDYQEQENAVMKLPPPTMKSMKQNTHYLSHHSLCPVNNSSSVLVDGNAAIAVHQMHLPQLLSPESTTTTSSQYVSGHPSSFLSSAGDDIHMYRSQHLLSSLTSSSLTSESFGSSLGRGGAGAGTQVGVQNHKGEDKLMVMNGSSCSSNSDWSFLDKLLLTSNYQSCDDHQQATPPPPLSHLHLLQQPLPSTPTFPFIPFHHYSDPNQFFNFSK